MITLVVKSDPEGRRDLFTGTAEGYGQIIV